MTTILVPFEDLMNAVEQLLYDKKLIKDTEFLIYADVGLHVSEGVVAIECELDNEEPALQLTRDPPAVEVIDEP